MKKKFTSILLIIFFATASCFSQSISKNQAIKICTNFLNSNLNPDTNQNLYTDVINVNERTENGQAFFYVVNFENGGFVILSADRRFYPILAYAFHGNFDFDNIPENCNTWIESWESQMLNAFENEGPYYESNAEIWDELITNKHRARTTKGVQPLLTCTWSQTAPHNQMCPADPEGFNGHTPVGCVALTMSQFMYYYRFPESGEGTVLYTPAYNFGVYGPQYVNYEASVYDWQAMTDICRESNNAIAQLCYHSGVAVETAYMPESSGANINNVSAALTGHFHYLTDDYLPREDVPNTSDWTAMLMENLDNNQPVLYRSSAGFGGHVYVCDGYQDSTHFHFNWGWGGAYNGYFYIDNLTPGGIQINYAHGAIFNIYPDTTQFEFPSFSGDPEILTNNVGSFEDGSANLDYLRNTQKSWLIHPADSTITRILLEFTMLDTENDNDIICVFDGDSDQAPLLETLSGSSLPVSIYSSGAALYITFQSNDSVQGSGFHSNYYGYHLPFCEVNQILTDPAGVLEDGSRYHQYINNSDCEWVIAPELSPVDSIQKVSLHFYQLDLAGGDTVFIYDGDNREAPLLGKFAAGTLPPDLISSGNKVCVNFQTDTLATAQGWAIGWDYILPEYCVDTSYYYAVEDTLSDGSGSKYYIENSDCYYMIEVADAESITLEFLELSVESNYDYLEIFDLEELNYPLDKISGFELPEEKTYPLNKLLIHFHSDNRDNYQGWKFAYKASVSGISEIKNPFVIYPNPCSDFLIINFQDYQLINSNFKIFHPNGKILASGKITSNTQIIDLEGLPPGLYFLSLTSTNFSFTKKIMKL